MNREEWLKTLKSDTALVKYPELDAILREHIKEKGALVKVEGALGDGVNMSAYVEDVIYPIGGGAFTKFYGVSYLYEGSVNNAFIDSAARTKRLIMASMEFLFEHLWLLPVFFILKKSVLNWLVRVYKADLAGKRPTFSKFSAYSRELIRVWCEIFKLELVRGKSRTRDSYYTKIQDLLADLIYLFVSFLEADSAYGLRFRDAFGAIDKTKNPLTEFKRIINLAISREKHISRKMLVVKKLLFLALWWPEFRRFIRDFISRADIEKIKLTEAAFYFCLRRVGYDYGGLSYEQRLKIAEKIDEEKKHIILGI